MKALLYVFLNQTLRQQASLTILSQKHMFYLNLYEKIDLLGNFVQSNIALHTSFFLQFLKNGNKNESGVEPRI